MAWGPVDNPVIGIVTDGYERYIQQGNMWLTQGQSALNTFANFHIEPIQFGGDYALTNVEQSFERPTRPAEPSLPSISREVPDLPTLAALIVRELGDAPDAPDIGHLLTYNAPAQPTVGLPSRPENNIQLIEVEVADRGPITLPVTPTLMQLGVVDFPALNLPVFQGQRPTFNVPVPVDGQLEFQEIEYTSALATAIKASLASMLQGGSGLPLAVEQAIFDRARSREDRLSRKQVQEVDEDMAQRNLTGDNGIHADRLREVRASNREKGAGLNRDVAIEVARIGVENARAALAQGVAYEQVLMTKVEAQNERALRVAIFAREYGLNRVAALTAIENLRLQAYATDAAVFKDLIAAELSKLQELEGRIRLEQLKGTVNENLIRQYEAQWRGVQALGEFYRTDVEAAKAKGEINKQRIEAAEVYARMYGTDVDAFGKVWDAHKSRVDASLAPLRAGEVISGIHANRIQAYRVEGEALRDHNRIQIESNGQLLDVARLAMQRADSVRQADSAAVDAVLRRFAGMVGLYQADGSIAQAESSSRDRVTALAIEQNRAVAQHGQQQQELQMNQMLKIAELMSAKLKGIADVVSQLIAASQSAVHLGATMSYNTDEAWYASPTAS